MVGPALRNRDMTDMNDDTSTRPSRRSETAGGPTAATELHRGERRAPLPDRRDLRTRSAATAATAPHQPARVRPPVRIPPESSVVVATDDSGTEPGWPPSLEYVAGYWLQRCTGDLVLEPTSSLPASPGPASGGRGGQR